MARTKIRIGVSSCLLGNEVRYDGQHKRDDFLTEVLDPFAEWVPVCPELELGLGVPREPIRLVSRPAGGDAPPRLVAERSGADHTEAMQAYAERRVAELAKADLDGYVLKKGSPSCGMERVRVYPVKRGPARRDGVGAFARVLLEALPLLPVEEEGRLHDPALRESFVERVFAYARWKAALAQGGGGDLCPPAERGRSPSHSRGMTRGALVAFHTAHKLSLLSHSPAAYRRLGALVGRLGKGSIAAQVAEYGAGFMEALRVPATRGRHVNVLQHMLGYFREALPLEDRKELETIVADFGKGLVPLVVPLTLVRHHVRRQGVEYLAGQTYLDPDPKELCLRNHV